jgi:hypothetical protein
MKLESDYGYKVITGEGTIISSLLNNQGVKVKFYDTINCDEYLLSLNSPTGYAFEISVSKAEIDEDNTFVFWKFPSADTDLGLKEMTFDQWPAEYLPDGFPNPEEEPNAKIKIVKMEQKKTGVFITIEGTNWDVGTYENNLCSTHGYRKDSTSFYRNKNGDYIYITNIQWGAKRDAIIKDVLQINKCNDLVKKD